MADADRGAGDDCDHFGVIAVLFPFGFQGVADGDFNLRLNFQGTSPSGTNLRVAICYGKNPDAYLETKRKLTLNWHNPAEWDGSLPLIRCNYSYPLKPDWLGRVDLTGPEIFHRLLLVEYDAPNRSPSYRVIPFERRRGQQVVEATVPREPPSDAEAWNPL